MKRDLDLLRNIMLALEEKLDYKATMQNSDLLRMLNIEGLTSEKLNYHLGLLCESNFIKVEHFEFLGGREMHVIKTITNGGQDFIDTRRQTETWNIVKAKAIEVGGFTLSLLAEIGIDYLKKQCGF